MRFLSFYVFLIFPCWHRKFKKKIKKNKKKKNEKIKKKKEKSNNKSKKKKNKNNQRKRLPGDLPRRLKNVFGYVKRYRAAIEAKKKEKKTKKKTHQKKKRP